MKKLITIIMVIIMSVSIVACNKQSDSSDKQAGNSVTSSENQTDNTDDIEKSNDNVIYGAVNGSEHSYEDKNNTTEKQNVSSSNNKNEIASDKNNSTVNNSNSPAKKPNNENNSSNLKPNLPNSSNNNTDSNKPTESTNPSKPEKPTEPTKPSKPDETTPPSTHVHNWTSGWFDTEIAVDKSGNKVSLHLCAKCYEYFGGTSSDEWVGRFWDHCDTVHESGYTTRPLYAYYDAEWCPGCDTMKRIKFAFYGYSDYSVSNKISTRKLEPWQVQELNLPLK